LVNAFLAKNNVTTLEHLSYHPDLTTAGCCLFPRQKSTLKGRHYCDATDVVNAMEELKMLSQDGFQEYFKRLYSRLHKCVVVQGDCFEGNVG
jgi:hypothetical protein